MKISRLEVSFVLEMNHGPYSCISENKAGLASTNFTLNILPGNVDDSFPSDDHSSDSNSPNAEASQNSHTKIEKDKHSESSNNNHLKNNNNVKSVGTESMVFGLIIGILVGIVLVLVTLSTAVVVMCRKKSHRSRISSSSSFNTHHTTKSDQSSTLDRIATFGLATESEVEKLTPSSLSTSSHVLMMGSIFPNGKSDCLEHESGYLLPSLQHHDPRNATGSEMILDPHDGSIYGRLNSSNGTNISGSVINPVQKPPRIGFGDQIDVPAGTLLPSLFL